MPQKIAIIGAGVIGLTTGIRLLEQGYHITLFARDIKTDITSRAAPAIWLPYKAAPEALILKWAKHSLGIYQNLDTRAGIQAMPITEYYHEDHGDPLWTQILTDYRQLRASELLPGFAKGFSTQTYQIDTSIYVDYLIEHFKKQGGNIVQQAFQQLPDVDATFPLIINCSGVWSNQLVPDKECFPIRGQYVLVEKPRGLNEIIFATHDDKGYTLIVPRQKDCYLGGTTLYHDWDTSIRPETSILIRSNAEQIDPRLIGMKTLKIGVGLRPGRNMVRLDTEQLSDGRTVIHHYGHGGSGFTVAWGAAEDVVNLVQER